MKGVSPVVATVLMVAVAIAAAVVAYSWFMSMQASVQAEASRGAGTVGKERIVVEAVQCYDSNDLNIYVRNIGDEPLTDALFTVNVKDAATGKIIDSKTAKKTIAEGSTEVLTVTGVSGLQDCKVADTQSNRIIVEVITPGGSVASREERIS